MVSLNHLKFCRSTTELEKGSHGSNGIIPCGRRSTKSGSLFIGIPLIEENPSTGINIRCVKGANTYNILLEIRCEVAAGCR
jgi:hypothetical protein